MELMAKGLVWNPRGPRSSPRSNHFSKASTLGTWKLPCVGPAFLQILALTMYVSLYNNQDIVNGTLLRAKQKIMEVGHVAHVGGISIS